MESTQTKSISVSITNASSTNTYEDAVLEWDFSRFLVEPGHCVCGQALEEQYMIKNRETEKELCLGRTCLDSLEIRLLSDIATIKKKETKNTDRKICACCLKLRLSATDEKYKIKCKPCLERGAEINQAYKCVYYRACKDCGENDIQPWAEHWRTLCSDCYQIKKDVSRECKQCGEKRIPITARESEDICFPCKQAGGKKACLDCGELNIFVAEKWRKVCVGCWRKKQ